ncbi:hypothetical protein [Ensifer aridi]|uniref:hypothetical protein n=1 Tax=Ensifer aridi TaxID=1708715 RepID=UPI0015E2738E|nr:hypothetical protein [Ensifer aridi]
MCQIEPGRSSLDERGHFDIHLELADPLVPRAVAGTDAAPPERHICGEALAFLTQDG